MRRIERESRGTMRPGQDLVVAGYAGLAGSCRIAAERAKELKQRFAASYIEELQRDDSLTERIRAVNAPGRTPAECQTYFDAGGEPVTLSSYWAALGASEWEEAGEGGIYTALWNLSGAYLLGFTVDLRRIPVKQGTIEICEYYGLNPYRLLSDGCVVLAADNGGRLAERLAAEGIAAAVVGSVCEGITREVTYGDVRGFMERPREDELTRLRRRTGGAGESA